MILRTLSTRPDRAMGAPPASSRRYRRAGVPLPPRFQPRLDPNLGGLFDTVTGFVSSAVSTAYHTTADSIAIPAQTVAAVATGKFSQVPSLLKQGASTVPLVGAAFGGGFFGSSARLPSSSPAASPAPAAEATGASGASLQDPAAVAAATQGLQPGTPEYNQALQAAGLAPARSGPPWGLILGVGGGVAALALLLRRRGP